MTSLFPNSDKRVELFPLKLAQRVPGRPKCPYLQGPDNRGMTHSALARMSVLKYSVGDITMTFKITPDVQLG